jgi:hypothetical protein
MDRTAIEKMPMLLSSGRFGDLKVTARSSGWRPSTKSITPVSTPPLDNNVMFDETGAARSEHWDCRLNAISSS